MRPLPLAFTRRLRMIWLLPCVAAALAPWPAPAADLPAANALTNGNFEGSSQPNDNLWDGVDSDNYLASFKHSVPVVTDKGSLSALAMPPSVAMADLNGDGKPDLITADPTGYFRFYPNHGTAAAPRFTTCEIIPIYLAANPALQTHEKNEAVRTDVFHACPRFALADWRRAGLLDLLVSDYFGETLFLPNTGNPRQPAFRQPTGYGASTSAHLPTSERQPFWANLLSPAAVDFDRNGHLDLLLGEGTYSANSIHLLRNASSGGVPKFTDAAHTQIAYGDGREQLIPTAVDYDGDGNTDLIVADRTGEVGVYLNPGKSQPPGSEFKRVATLSFGGTAKLPGLCSIYAADYNGDGLFDLIIGMSTGHIAVARNSGTKGNPSFGPIQEIKGEDRFGRNLFVPDGWIFNTHPQLGNALAFASVVDATLDPASQPPEGTHCLKVGYTPLGGETFVVPPEGIPGMQKWFIVEQPKVTLSNNKTYQLSFRVKGAGMEKMRYHFRSVYEGTPDPVKVERGERGEMKNHREVINEIVDPGGSFSSAANWNTVTGTLNIAYKNAALQELPSMTGTLYIECWASSLSSVVYLDDFKLIQK